MSEEVAGEQAPPRRRRCRRAPRGWRSSRRPRPWAGAAASALLTSRSTSAAAAGRSSSASARISASVAGSARSARCRSDSCAAARIGADGGDDRIELGELARQRDEALRVAALRERRRQGLVARQMASSLLSGGASGGIELASGGRARRYPIEARVAPGHSYDRRLRIANVRLALVGDDAATPESRAARRTRRAPASDSRRSRR